MNIMSKMSAIMIKLYPPFISRVWRIITVNINAIKSPNWETPFHIESANVSDLLKYWDKTYD